MKIGKAVLVTFFAIIMLGVGFILNLNRFEQGPYTLQEALNSDIPYPLYLPNSEYFTNHPMLEARYHFYELDEPRLEISLMDKEGGSQVASLTVSVFDLIGPIDELQDNVDITWAIEGQSSECKVYQSQNPEYLSCLYWRADWNSGWLAHKLYTVWPIEETRYLANSLEDKRQ